MTGSIGRIETQPIRKAFPKEAQDFTIWLESHIDALADRLGIELNVVQREKDVGDFSVDLLCEDDEGRPVIIENQLEKTDHDHLGKLLTYLVNLNANTAIWITAEPRPEHKRVMDWLNESTPANVSFYLVKVEALRIGDSPFAPLFTVQAGPDEQAKAVGEKKKEWAERHHRRHEFWTQFIERSAAKSKLFVNRTAGPHSYLSAGIGKSGVQLSVAIAYDSARAELYIDFGKDAAEKNKLVFDVLLARKEEIEQEFGEPLEWLRLDDKRASIVRKTIRDGGLLDQESWPAIQDALIDAAMRLERVFRPRLAKIAASE